jgi:hypothetical protein
MDLVHAASEPLRTSLSRAGSTRIDPMTAKEKLHRFIDGLSDGQAEHARIVVKEEAAESIVDEWGDLDAQMSASMVDALHELDEEERNAGLPPWQP